MTNTQENNQDLVLSNFYSLHKEKLDKLYKTTWICNCIFESEGVIFYTGHELEGRVLSPFTLVRIRDVNNEFDNDSCNKDIIAMYSNDGFGACAKVGYYGQDVLLPPLGHYNANSAKIFVYFVCDNPACSASIDNVPFYSCTQCLYDLCEKCASIVPNHKHEMIRVEYFYSTVDGIDKNSPIIISKFTPPGYE